ncbi:hypothetical protein BB560_000075 [Smittium megazygosporum]|uniref:Uncharacterized protein n=1 Tax=Smittium megazygosporum TaxID=133381 RepID=A0A2T9ZLG4_9FUNG|nr:hypothetical protein BB560_000075 [Smittium megazygosporum]
MLRMQRMSSAIGGLLSKRQFSGGRILRAVEKATESGAQKSVLSSPSPAKRKVGGFRGGVFGFLLGSTLASAYGYFYLLDVYERSNAMVLSSISELEALSVNIRLQLETISVLEARLEKFESNYAKSKDLEQLSASTRSQIDNVNRSFLDLKARILKNHLEAVESSPKESTTTKNIAAAISSKLEN